MKVRSISLTLKAALLPIVVFPLLVSAQSVINRVATPYLVTPEIEFAIAGPAIAIAASPAPKVVPAVSFAVLATDRTIRDVLQRWARASGWKHESIHWTLMLDFPVHGTAPAEFFGGDFREATRKLLASTDTTDLPAQPCFYTNFIVRVVPQAELCDRNATAAH